MAKLPGYFFIILGIAGAIFFYSYTGTEIQSKELWIVFSIFFVIIGGFLLAKQKVESIRRDLNQPKQTEETNTQTEAGENLP